MAVMNTTLDDDSMAAATGGMIQTDRYGFVCEATVSSGPGTSTVNGVTGTDYTVEADNGRSYIARWAYSEVLHPGDRVQLIHDDDGGYSLEPIPAEGF